MKTLPLDWLLAYDACEKAVEVFVRVFPNGAPLTLASAAKARAVGLDLGWLACTLRGVVLDEYEDMTAAAWTEYERARTAAMDEYKCVMAAARAKHEYKCVMAAARAEYERVVAPVRAEYERVRAAALLHQLRMVPVGLEPTTLRL